MANTTISERPVTERDAVVNPRTGKPATAWQGALLLAGSCLPVLGAVLLSPLLPSMTKAFASTPGSDALVPLVLTVPALFIAILSPFAGAIIDKLGRKRVLIIALFLYALLGTAPLWVQPLGGILVTRIGVGITEAFIMTSCTTLLADYFTGARRDRYLGLQATVTALAATAFFAIGGALGSIGWRAPFWLYVVSVVLAVLMIFAIWPTRQTNDGAERSVAKLPPLNWSVVLLPGLVTIFGGIVFYTPIVELPYLITGLGVTATAAIGGVTAIASLATAIGAFSFRWIAKYQAPVLLPIGLGLAGVGLLIAAFAPAMPVLVIGAVIASFGTGILLPTLITWAISRLDYDQRGRGTGIFVAAIFFGEFICPLAVLAISGGAHSLGAAVAVVAAVSIVLAVLLGVVLRRREPVVA
jgi:MFS family permease